MITKLIVVRTLSEAKGKDLLLSTSSCNSTSFGAPRLRMT